ncbi:uncharacterized protein [Diadema setosum]|uniref:uncharacterized protein n=1 Tax=Diadema setosum TaxID=31175 RepID=UPI003B3A9317
MTHCHESLQKVKDTIDVDNNFRVQTVPILTVWKGETASLPCVLPYTPYRVQWVNGSSEEVVASYTDGVFKFPSGGTGRFSMGKDLSLTINDVSVRDEGMFTCEVFSLDSRRWSNQTEFIVNAYGARPSFDGCQGSEYCTKEVRSREFQISCSVRGAKPDVNMSMIAAGKSILTNQPLSFGRQEDGTRDQTINANVQMTSDKSVETFTCLASGVAVNGTRSATKTVIVTSAQ